MSNHQPFDETNQEVKLIRAIEKINCIMTENSSNSLVIQREYLPEIFSSELLEISKHDGLPALKLFSSEYLNLNGIKNELYGNVIEFEIIPNISIQKVSPHQVMKRTQTLVNQALDKKDQRKVMTTISDTKKIDLTR